MSDKYKIRDNYKAYYIIIATVSWVDVFRRKNQKLLIIESLKYCQRNKGLIIFGYCLMTNHVHLIFRSIDGQKPELLLGDFKRFTSKKIVNLITVNPKESRKEWLLEQFMKAGSKSSNVKKYQFWRHDNKPIELWSSKVINEKISYIHQNPVEEGLVYHPEDYVYSSARDYAGEKGLIDGIIVIRY